MNLRPVDAAAVAPVTAFSKENSSFVVLVVDDSRDVREFISLLLRLSGYQVLQAKDGVAAQEILQSKHPALVICDLEMPVGNGWDVLAFCHWRHPALPVLIVSGAGLGRRPEIESWAAGYLPKPINLVRFHDEVERLIRRAA